MKMKVMIDDQVYIVDVEDIHTRPVVAVVEGQRYEIWPEEAQDMASKQVQPSVQLVSVPEPLMTADSTSRAGADQLPNQVVAPLPGVILAVLVKEGDQVARGQELCTLEAMKMKNAIKSNREGVVKSVAVNVGDQVNHGQILMTFTE